MINGQDIEGYLIRMGVPYRELGRDTWMIEDEYDSIDNLVVTLNSPVVFFRVKLSTIPERCDRLKLFEALLRLNAEEMLHGAYGLEGDSIVATDTLQSESLDFNEFQATVDSLGLAIATHYRRLSPFLKPQAA